METRGIKPEVLRRLLGEAGSAWLNYKLLTELEGYGRADPLQGVTRGEVVHLALDEDLRHRTTRLFDASRRARSFAWLAQNFEQLVRRAAEDVDVDLDWILQHGQKWKRLRDKTIAHIDEESIRDAAALWREADLKWRDVERCLAGVWKICDALYPSDSPWQVRPPVFPADDPPLQIEYATPPEGRDTSSG